MNSVQPARSYLTDFDTDAYYNTATTLEDTGAFQDATRFILDCLHEIFHPGLVSGDHLLDVGTGVSFASFASSSRHVTDIHVSDLLTRHLDMLQRWLDGEDRAADIIDYVMMKENDGTARSDRLTELRTKVKRLCVIDVTKRQPLEDNDRALYDVITSSFCLEAATKSVAEFQSSVKNVVTLLKKGGYIVLVGALGEEYFIVGNYKFWNANVKEHDVRSALFSTGCSIIFWKTLLGEDTESLKSNKFARLDGIFVVAAQKDE